MRTERAIIVINFGSADDFIRKNIFDRLSTEISQAFENFEIKQAFTSNFMIKKLLRRGILMFTPEQAISKLRAEGFKRIILLPTHLTPGEEFDNKIKRCAAADVEIIPPLFSENCSTPFDKKIFSTILNCFQKFADEDLILIGHGSPHRHNPVYENLQRIAGEKIHIGVIEETDSPNFSDVVRRLEKSRAEKVLLAPLLLNGGVHVEEDIAGEEDSWKTKLAARNYKIRVIRDGLGSFEKFRELYLEKLATKIQ